MIEFWNERYREEGWAYGMEPNQWLKKKLHPASSNAQALFAAEGQGRNAVYAAEQGWKVSAFDLSEAGRQRALELAREKGVELDYKISDALAVDHPKESFDLLVLIFAHFPAGKRMEIHRHLLELLRPGGLVIFEAYTKEQLAYQKAHQSGGPQQWEMLFNLEEIGREFSTCDIIELEMGETVLAEGKYHQGKAHTVRFIGCKR